MVADPGLLQVIGCAHQREPDTALSWHLVGLVTTVLYRLEERERGQELKLDFWLWLTEGEKGPGSVQQTRSS